MTPIAGKKVRRAILGSVCLTFAIATGGESAIAEDRIYSLHIEPQPLSRALTELARQTDHLLLAPGDIPDTQAPGLVGEYSVSAALSRLLEDCDLQLEQRDGMILLTGTPAPDPVAAEADDGVFSAGPHGARRPEPDIIVVRSFRGSLDAALEAKRRSILSSDSVRAEDIADFPDLNLGDALQRIPGIVVERDNGETRHIGLRGLGPLFTRTQINGIEALVTTNSAFDHRGSASRSRNFDFNVFAAELFQEATVLKSYEASLDEGGIAGTINLKTPQPLDYQTSQATLITKGTYNDLSEAVKPRLAGLVSTRGENVGLLLSAAWSETDMVEFGHRDWDWRTFSPDSYGPGIRSEDIARIERGELVAPTVATYNTVNRIQERFGLTSALQWRPSDRADISLTGLYASFRNEDREYQLANQNLGHVTDLAFDEHGTVLYGAFEGADIRSEAKQAEASTRFYQIALSGDFRVTDRLSVNAVGSYSDSVFRMPVFDKIFLQAVGHEFSFDYRNGRRRPVNTYDFDIADAANWVLHRADIREDRIANEYATLEANGNYQINGNHALRLGVQYKNYVSSGYERREDVRGLNASGIPFSASAVTLPSIAPYAVADIDATFARLLATNPTGRITGLPFTRDAAALGPAANSTGKAFDLTEKTFAAYIQHDFAFSRLRGNIGLRYVTTDVGSQGDSLLISDDNGDGVSETSFVPVLIENRYSELLPAFNLVADMTDALLFRFSGSRNISRPNLSDLRAAANINISGNSISNGNPELEPFIANSFEASAEYYFGELNYISVAAFAKDLQSFIVNETRAVSFEDTGLPEEFLTEDRVGQMFSINRPVNGEGGTIQGLEIAGQYEFLPGLGIIGNYTYADGKTTYSINGQEVEGPLMGLSKHSFNLTGYYETGRWGIRASAAYRDRYFTGTSNENMFNGINDTTFVDAAAFYNVSDRIKITLEAINLTNEKIDDFANPVANRPQVNLESGRTFLLGASFTL